MKKHLTIYTFIAVLVMGFTGNAVAAQCSENMKTGTCKNYNNKNQHDCEAIFQFWSDDGGGKKIYTHCKWDVILKTCDQIGNKCNVLKK
jgi:hypothetical protein